MKRSTSETEISRTQVWSFWQVCTSLIYFSLHLFSSKFRCFKVWKKSERQDLMHHFSSVIEHLKVTYVKISFFKVISEQAKYWKKFSFNQDGRFKHSGRYYFHGYWIPVANYRISSLLCPKGEIQFNLTNKLFQPRVNIMIRKKFKP